MKNFLIMLLTAAVLPASADVPLIGQTLGGKSVLSGDFDEFRANWRRPAPSSNWTIQVEQGGGKAGFAERAMMISGPDRVTFESVVLDHTEVKSLKAGDVLAWRFSSNSEYPCDGRVSLALLFGDQERKVTDRVRVPNGPEPPRTYEGYYTVSPEDATLGMPRLKFTLESSHHIIVYVHWVDLKLVKDPAMVLTANAVDAGVELSWSGEPDLRYAVFRSQEERTGFKKIADGVSGNRWVDAAVVHGKPMFYAVKRGAAASTVAKGVKFDSVAPAAPVSLRATGGDWVVNLSWATNEKDVAYYKVYRGNADDEPMTCIAPKVTRTVFEDMLPVKGVDNVYAVRAVDHSGNEGVSSTTVRAGTLAVPGASFSDLIRPMPIHKQLRHDVWGGDNVLPRDPDNGVEDSFWSYWGGKVIQDSSDGLYHMLVVRWPEGDRKGHWAWPYSTVAHVVSEKPTGPYRVIRDTVYDFQNGEGHNANIIPLNDGRFALYSLIKFKPMIFVADSMNGPWELLGEMKAHAPDSYENAYRLERNLSGVQCEDGSFLFVTKAGAMMRSVDGILGPYEVVSPVVGENKTIPEKYRRSNYEDPTMWYDGIQYHMIINAFLDYRAIYLRSPDGVHWKYEDGFAYTPTCTLYEDGTRTFWYKVERPNTLQDEFGRATHLSLAAIDSTKAEDYGNDAHSSKHLIIPLTVPKRLKMLNEVPVTSATKEIRVLIYSEEGFDAEQDLNLDGLRFGGSESVNFGGGAKLKDTQPHPDGLVLVFDGAGNDMTERNFVCKLIGTTKSGGLVVGYSTRSAE